MEYPQEQSGIGCKVIIFGIIEAVVVGGLLWVWFIRNAWIEPLPPTLPYSIGAVLLLQLIVGLISSAGSDSSSPFGKAILYCLLITVMFPPLAVLAWWFVVP